MVFTVWSGKCDNVLINALYISLALPSKNFPQPPVNNVSPVRRKNYASVLLMFYFEFCVFSKYLNSVKCI